MKLTKKYSIQVNKGNYYKSNTSKKIKSKIEINIQVSSSNIRNNFFLIKKNNITK